MPITSSGFATRRLPEIRESIRLRLQEELGGEVRSSPDSVIGVILSGFASEVSKEEMLIQSLMSNYDPYEAEGVGLDRVVSRIGLRRQPARPSSGQLKVWRDSTGSTTSTTTFRSVDNVDYLAVEGLTHNLNACSEVLLTISDLTVGQSYDLFINGNPLLYTAQGGDTIASILENQATLINSTLSVDATVEDNTLRIVDNATSLNDMVVNAPNYTPLEIATYNYVESAIVGELVTPVNSITQVVSGNPAIIRCLNPLNFVSGKDVETDEELRLRYDNDLSIAGTATVDAIRSELLNINGVEDALVVENINLVPDAAGREGKSYEAVVLGGAPNDIGNTIWRTKGAGIKTVGGETSIVQDRYGNLQSVNWSRPDQIYTWVRVTYSRYEEEQLPNDANDTITEAVLDYGNSRGLGEDIIPKRFIGPIYRALSGIGDITIEVGTSELATSSAPDSWTELPIPIDLNEYAVFASGRILVEEV